MPELIPKPYLPAIPLDESEHRIVKIESAILTDIFPSLLVIRIHTNTGFIGHGETYYAPQAVSAMLHDWMARRLIGSDPLAIESHWRFFYERAANFGVRGTELRAISAIDLALWDIFGQVTQQPIYRLLGGPVRNCVPVYNSLANPNYGIRPDGTQGWPGYGVLGKPGPLEDSYNFFNNPEELAHDLLESGYTAFKTWAFDKPAHEHGGMRISHADIERGLIPLRKIRDAVGNKLEIMIDGHGFFMLPAAIRIAEALEEIKPLWIEDIIKMDSIETLANFREKSPVPISASEMLLSRADFADVLMKRAADYIMVDPTWAGGISECVRIAHMAQAFNVPTTTHDCSGPLTLMAGVHINAAVPGCCFQETARAHIKTVYKDLIDDQPQISNGHMALPTKPGLGVKLNPDFFNPSREGYRSSDVTKK
jgi:galactonate dehydratase